MKKISSKYYKFAGLDFMFDEDENPWFVEANFSSHGIPYVEKTNHKVIKKLIKLLKKNGKDVCYLVGKKRKNIYGSSKWVYDFLKTQINLHYGYFEDNKKSKGSIITKDKNEINPSTIFAYNALDLPLHIRRTFPNKFLNHPKISELVTNKYKLYKIIKNSKVLVPKTYLVKNKDDVSKILKKHKIHNGFVIKPIKGTYGQ
ncbi:MAG: hypothetical protein CMH64_04765, partial [Nanoarchaeota archaeon]|nr:hypothetical protein [Nanoarchaeota archaeon]